MHFLEVANGISLLQVVVCNLSPRAPNDFSENPNVFLYFLKIPNDLSVEYFAEGAP